MSAFSGGLSPNIVKTALDDVFMQEFDAAAGPQVARASDPFVFKQSTADSSAVIMEDFKGVSLWGTRAEEQDVESDTPQVGNQKTHSVLNFAKSVDITKNLFDDDKHSTVQGMIRDFGEMARISQDDNAMESYRLGFTTHLTSDGIALYSNSHVNLNGDTVDNLETGALSEANLEIALQSLGEQLNQAGVVRGHEPQTLLVPMALYKEATQILASELRSGTANNDINVYSSKYGITIKQSPYLGSAAGGSDTAWFLLARNHSMNRWVRQGLATDLVDSKYQRNNSYIYKGEFREVVGAQNYEGQVGSDGST